MKLEYRQATELRAAGRKLSGYAATFNNETHLGDFSELIRPGAFKRALAAKKDILCLIDHSTGRLLARTKSGTLRLEEDERGLKFELDIPETQDGKDILALAERGDLGGMSFGFRVAPNGETWTGRRRELTEIDLAEISVVLSWPAYNGTEVQARSKTPALSRARRFLETI